MASQLWIVAVMIMHTLQQVDPDPPMHWMQRLALADELAAGGQHAEASRHFGLLIEAPRPQDLSPLMVERIRLRLAQAQLEAGAFDAARSSLQPLLHTAVEGNREARALLASVEATEREARRSRARGIAAIRRDPESPWGYRDLAEALRLQGQLGHALDLLAAELPAWDPRHSAALIDAVATLGTDASSTAIELATQALIQRPDDTAIRAILLDLAIRRAPLPQALAIHTELEPLLPLARLRLAHRLAEEQHGVAALGEYQPLLDDPETGLAAHLESAALLETLAGPEQVLAMLRRAVEGWPDAGPGDPRRRGKRQDPYTKLVRHALRHGSLDQLWNNWPALDGPHGALIRHHLATALQQLRASN